MRIDMPLVDTPVHCGSAFRVSVFGFQISVSVATLEKLLNCLLVSYSSRARRASRRGSSSHQSTDCIGEDKRWNPRIAGKTEAEYERIVASLDLPYPKMMDVAVPSNLMCGQAHAGVIVVVAAYMLMHASRT
jgi:hypothetical protein